ncbi:MAG TPA: LysR family transcriptional regulator [Mycobacterium sp.]|jgi:DNA-binding transcriptional LysR family regulator|uniref:LysR family transcriptional regulator n=1 Tax=Mycobacterium sp. TaxID=1785 RepID=UPI002F40D37E
MTTLRTLECLVALVDHGSVSAAAAALYMSQPALSHQIASLEKELGAPVAERLWRGVRITAAGRATAEEARVALQAAEQAVKIGQRVARAGTGRIRISCVETMTAWLLLPVLRQWRSRRPDVHLDLSEFTSADAMLELLEAGRTDVAFGPRPTRTDAHVTVFGKEEVVVVAAAGHPFTDLSGVPFSALVSEPFVHYHPDNGMATWVDQLAAHHDVVLDPVLRTGSPRTAAQLAAAGMGVTIVPVSALPSRPTGTVRRLRPMIKRDVVAVVAAPSDTLVHQFVSDIHRRGLPAWAGPT